jgi:hypothetical protein
VSFVAMLTQALRRVRWLIFLLMALPIMDLALGKLAGTAGRHRPTWVSEGIQSVRTQIRISSEAQHRRPGAPELDLRQVTRLGNDRRSHGRHAA